MTTITRDSLAMHPTTLTTADKTIRPLTATGLSVGFPSTAHYTTSSLTQLEDGSDWIIVSFSVSLFPPPTPYHFQPPYLLLLPLLLNPRPFQFKSTTSSNIEISQLFPAPLSAPPTVLLSVMYRPTVWLSLVLAVVSVLFGCCDFVSGESVSPVSVRGCAESIGTYGTSGCNYNDLIWLSGVQLPTGSGVTLSITGNYTSYVFPYNVIDYTIYATGVIAYNSTMISARLPYLAVRTSHTASVQIRNNNNVVATAVDSVIFSPQTPLVYRVTGCSVDNVVVTNSSSSNGTAGCQPNINISVFGERFLPTPLFQLSVFVGGHQLSDCVVLSVQQINCNLVSIPTANYYNWLFVQVVSGDLWNVFGSPPANFVMFGAVSSSSSSSTGQSIGSSSSSSSVSPVSITKLSECAIPNRCTVSDLIVLTGRGFNSMMSVALMTNSSIYGCGLITFHNSTSLSTYLAFVPMPPYASSQWFYVRLVLLSNGNIVAEYPLYYYSPLSSSSSSSSTATLPRYSSSTAGQITPASFSDSSESGLSTGVVAVIVLVMLLVVAPLLLCQLLYCLHRFAGVQFPRLARLTDSRLFKVEAQEADKGAAIDLSLLANDHHKQQQPQPVLTAVYPQPPSTPTSTFYLPPTVTQPTSDAHFHPSYVPPRSATSYLHPRAFVPSPQYYQPA